jgi:site-specific DNA-methyltransferase (adenine-specific)
MLQIELVPIGSIRPYENNAKIHTREQIEQIKKSIEEFGNNDPIAIDGEGVIIEGHGRLMALQELGYTEVEVIRLGHLNEEQRKAYTLIHNKLTMNTGFDLDILATELQAIENINMKDYDFELDINDDMVIEDIEEDNFSPEVPEEATAKRGQVYQLGEHRLMCGDSTSPADVQKLMGDEQADCLCTDPPYNVNYGGDEHSPASGKHRVIENDNLTDSEFYKFLLAFYQNAEAALKPGGSFYIWHADSEGYNFRKALRDAGLQLRQTLIWNKNSLVLGRQDYQWKHEPCLYGWKDGAAHYFTSSRSETTVIEDEVPDFSKMKKEELVKMLESVYSQATTVIDEMKPSKSDLHPTMKPLRLMAYLIQNSTRKGEIVLDLFGGSGSTLIAAEETKRRCRMMEYDPRYVDVIIQRWEEQTGKKAELLTD